MRSRPESAGAAAGFQPGDLVLAINGRPVESFPDMQQIVSTSAGETLTFERTRGAHVTLKADAALKESGPIRQRSPHRSARHHPVVFAR